MIQVFIEAGIVLPPVDQLDEYFHAAEDAGGFALTGRLVEANHGAGIWICPVNVPGLESMVPWQFVKSVVTAGDPPSSKIFGLVTDLAKPNSASKTT
jgi:hypothetical protein